MKKPTYTLTFRYQNEPERTRKYHDRITARRHFSWLTSLCRLHYAILRGDDLITYACIINNNIKD